MFRFVSLFFFIFFLNTIAAADDLNPADTCRQHHCIAVVDAGSTGSRLHIYAFDRDENSNPVNINEVWSKKVKPGFATLAPSPEAINPYLTNLFSDAPSQNMPLFFYATAGMRLLSTTKQAQYYRTLESWFAQQGQWQLVSAKTITGRNEGLYAWLAVNYQTGALTDASKPLSGVLDMGGASVQVALPISNDAGIEPNDLLEFDIYDRHIKLFSHSFLGLGQVVLTYQFLTSPECFANGYELPSGLPGEGDARTCESSVAKLINDVHGVDKIIKPVIANNQVYSWYALGGLPAMASEQSFHFKNNQLTGQKLLEEGDNQFCHQQWEDIQSHYQGHEYVYGYCLFPAYYYALMVDGYGLSSSNEVNYFPALKEADWTLGVVLHQPQT